VLDGVVDRLCALLPDPLPSVVRECARLLCVQATGVYDVLRGYCALPATRGSNGRVTRLPLDCRKWQRDALFSSHSTPFFNTRKLTLSRTLMYMCCCVCVVCLVMCCVWCVLCCVLWLCVVCCVFVGLFGVVGLLCCGCCAVCCVCVVCCVLCIRTHTPTPTLSLSHSHTHNPTLHTLNTFSSQTHLSPHTTQKDR
jgi:hypothetical protein